LEAWRNASKPEPQINADEWITRIRKLDADCTVHGETRSKMKQIIRGKMVVAGSIEGEILASCEPLSLWGGYDARSGEIIDQRHPLAGQNAAGKILALPAARGSSTTTAVLLEAVHNGTAPAAIVTRGIDRFFSLAAIIAGELYGKTLPVVAVGEEEFAELMSGEWGVIGECDNI
jgi:predicted aconitase with swiveling domain